MLDTVRAAYAAGLCLLPVREDGTKQPDVSAWKPFQAVRPTVVQMRGFDFGKGHRAARHRLALPALGLRALRGVWLVDDGHHAPAWEDTQAVPRVPLALQARPARLS